MKKILINCLIALLVLSGCSNNSNSNVNVEPTNFKLIAYKAEDINTGNYIYVFGTHHTGKAEYYPLRDEIENAFNESTHLVVEFDTNNTENRKAVNAPDFTFDPIRDIGLEAASKEMLETVLLTYPDEVNGMKLNYDTLSNYNAMGISVMLSSTIDIGLGSYHGFDSYFLRNAKKNNKEIVEIEGAIFSRNLVPQLNDCCSDFIIQSIPTFDEGKSIAIQLNEHVLNGDAEKIAMSFIPPNTQASEEEREHFDVFIGNRNDNMTLKAIEYINSGEIYFIAVGAGHVVGETGIINQLEQLGYNITRI